MSHPYDPYAGPPAHGGWPPQPYGSVPAQSPPPPPGHGAPPPRPGNRRVVAWTVAGSLLAAALLALVTVAGYRMGSSELLNLPPAASTSPPADWAVIGDDAGLDPYARRCHDGLLAACDELYSLAEPGSDYEYYALTCGGRVHARAVSLCVLLE